MREIYSDYMFEVFPNEGEWVYEIYYPEYPELPAMRVSTEWFDTEQEARFAAIGHINLLENGEG